MFFEIVSYVVPIVPDWVRGDSLSAWARSPPAAPLAALLNRSLSGHAASDEHGARNMEQLTLGLVLGAKALTQLATAPLASACVGRVGALPVLRVATGALLVTALMFAWGGAGGAWWVCAGRAAHGAGSALTAVAGMSLAAAVAPAPRRDDALAALLGAVALGVLVGYPFGGAADALWSRAAPFLLLALALAADLVLQMTLLNREELAVCGGGEGGHIGGCAGVRRVLRRGAVRACAGAVLLTTSAMATLEPCLPAWLERLGAQHWQLGAAFLPDSAAYLIATTILGGRARRLGSERVAVCGVVAVGCAALCVPLARSAVALAPAHAALGAGLGAADAALVPALAARYPRRIPALAAALQAASSAAYALGPVCGGAVAAAFGFPAAMRALGVGNLLYAAVLYRALVAHPLSSKWGADGEPDTDTESESEGGAPQEYHALREHAPRGVGRAPRPAGHHAEAANSDAQTDLTP
ncbi:Synaptic vesicular amine transporter [Eumeta japonica]|uniref:Synaptic vesicular amine transporter n=1 Tax=Eumeta variegata TaxID=151549 RepID=A0A4C1XW66_EUMVA|nr:Synaptic vesicular amine transporter [Eumeta japonica]